MPEQRIVFQAQLDDIQAHASGPIDGPSLQLDLQLQLVIGYDAAALSALLHSPGRWVKVEIEE